jgi:hypothetical protein
MIKRALPAHPTNNVGNRFTKSDQETKEFLGSRKQCTIFLDIVIDLDDARPSQELHDETRRNNGTDTKFHQSATVGSENDTHPVKWIGRLGALDTVNWDLTADQENEESYGGPKKLFTEGDLEQKER